MISKKQLEIINELLKKEIKEGKEVCLTVSTPSMKPILDSEDEIIVKYCDIKELSKGDIILYEDDGNFYSHRFLSRKYKNGQPLLVIKSDNSFHKLLLPENQFLGKVIKIKKKIEFTNLITETRENRVSSLFYFYFKNRKENLSEEFLKLLEKDYYQTLCRNILIWEEIKPIIKTFEENKTDIILLKGIFLSMVVYSSPGLRPVGDIDVLVRTKDILKVDKILNNFGYFPVDIKPSNIKIDDIGYLTTLDYRNNKNFSIHLHYHLVNSTVPNFSYISRINMDRIFEKAEVIEKDGIKFLTLSPEHLIIYLCEHGLRVTHSLSKLIFLTDISYSINYYKDRINWDFLIKESYSFGLERMVYFSLYTVNKVLKIEIPEKVLSSLKPKRITLGEKFFLSCVLKNRSFSGLSWFIHLAMNKNIFQKTKFIFRTFFPPKRVLAQQNYISQINYSHYFSRLKQILFHIKIIP